MGVMDSVLNLFKYCAIFIYIFKKLHTSLIELESLVVLEQTKSNQNKVSFLVHPYSHPSTRKKSLIYGSKVKLRHKYDNNGIPGNVINKKQ